MAFAENVALIFSESPPISDVNKISVEGPTLSPGLDSLILDKTGVLSHGEVTVESSTDVSIPFGTVGSVIFNTPSLDAIKDSISVFGDVCCVFIVFSRVLLIVRPSSDPLDSGSTAVVDDSASLTSVAAKVTNLKLEGDSLSTVGLVSTVRGSE